MALGATTGNVLALVIWQGMLLITIGIAIGIAGSLLLTKVISGLLYSITPTDLPAFVGTALLFAVMPLVATFVSHRFNLRRPSLRKKSLHWRFAAYI